MTRVYLDTSVVIRRLLRQPHSIEDWGEWHAAYASGIMHVEAMRCIDRLRLQGILDDPQYAQLARAVEDVRSCLHEVPLSPAIVERAAQPFGVVVGTLDALHLATALLLRQQAAPALVFLTHDHQLATAATALSFAVRGI